MKKLLFFSICALSIVLLSRCAKNEISNLENALDPKSAPKTMSVTQPTKSETLYLSKAGTIQESAYQSYDLIKIYQGSTMNRRLKVTISVTDKRYNEIYIEPREIFLGGEYPKENVFNLGSWLLTIEAGPIENNGVITRTGKLKIINVWDFDLNRDITKDIRIFPEEGVSVSATTVVLRDPNKPS